MKQKAFMRLMQEIPDRITQPGNDKDEPPRRLVDFDKVVAEKQEEGWLVISSGEIYDSQAREMKSWVHLVKTE